MHFPLPWCVLHHDGEGAASQLELAAEEAGFFTLEKGFPNPSAAPNGNCRKQHN
jgi:hypothetical protein